MSANGHQEVVSSMSYSEAPVVPYEICHAYDYAIHEGLPAIASHHPSFTLAKEMVAKAASDLSQPVSTENVQDVELNNIADGLKDLRAVNFGKTVSVGVVGDTGMGKSSLMNSLLEHDLATEGDGGTSCTQIVTEYVFSAASEGDYFASIVFKDSESIKNDVKDHFEKYQKFRKRSKAEAATATQNSDEEGDEDEDDASKFEHLKTASEYLRQLFATRPGFHNATDFEKMMGGLSADGIKARIDVLQRVAEEMLLKMTGGGESNSKSLRSSGLKQLSLQTKKYTDNQPARRQAYWPIVDRVQIFLNSPFLGQHIQIADCPGMSDTNLSRRQATQKYLQACKVIIVVGDINRILDSTAVQKYLDLYIPHVGPERVLLLATKCEVIDHSPKDATVTAEQSKQLEVLESLLAVAQKAKIRAREKASKEDLIKARHAVADAEADLKRARALVRKISVVTEARRRQRMRYGEEARSLRIIAVSSRVHQIYTSGEADESPPCLKVDEDGIAEVRATLCAMAQRAYPDLMRRHISSRLRIQINKLAMATDRAPNRRIGNVLKIVDDFHNRSTAHTEADMQKLRQIFTETVHPALDSELLDTNSMWMTKIKKQVRSWQVMLDNGQTFKAIACRNGVHKPCYIGQLLDLNQDIIIIIKQDVAKIIRLLRPALEKLKQQILDDGLKALDELFRKLKSNGDLRDFNMEAFYDNFRVHKENFGDSLEASFEGFVETVHDIAMHEMSNEWGTAFNDAMRDMYEAARNPVNVSKTGHFVVKRRWCFVRDALIGAGKFSESGAPLPLSPLQALARASTKGVQKQMKDEKTKLRRIMQTPFEGVKDDLKTKFKTDRESEFIKPKQRAEIKRQVEQVLPGAEEKLKKALECIDEAELAFAPRIEDPDEDMVQDGEFEDNGEVGDLGLDDEMGNGMEDVQGGDEDQ